MTQRTPTTNGPVGELVDAPAGPDAAAEALHWLASQLRWERRMEELRGTPDATPTPAEPVQDAPATAAA